MFFKLTTVDGEVVTINDQCIALYRSGKNGGSEVVLNTSPREVLYVNESISDLNMFLY